jgi:hypothetical protein
MDELENRLRRGLQHPSMSAEATEILADVHRGVRNRQQRRLAVGAAGVLAVLTATGVLTGTTTGPDRDSDVATSPTSPTSDPSETSETSATTRPATPAGSLTGTTGFDATPTGSVFWVSAETCAGSPCSVLHRAEPGVGSEEVHTFEYDDPAVARKAELPPVESVTVSDDERDLWVHAGWDSGPRGAGAEQLWTSHDGGAHWAQQDLGGNPTDRVLIEPVGDQVFALQGFPVRVWRSPAGSDDWSPVALPDGYTYADQLTSLGNSVVVSAMKADQRMMLTLNAAGGSWHEAEAPCQGEVGAIRRTGTELLAPCPGDGSFSDAPLVLWRSWDGEMWKPFAGVTHSSYVENVVPIDDDAVFVVTGDGGLVVTEDGQEQVDLPMGRSDGALYGEFADAEHGYLLVTSPPALLATEDGGHTWSPFE